MNDKKAESELKTLYQITGNAADINTILINRGEFRHLRARVAELEAQLESIGAGGVGPLMKPVISSHVDQHLDKVWLPRTLLNRSIQEIVRYCNTGEMDDAESLLASLQFSIDPAQQPPKDEPAPMEFRA